MPRTSRDAEFSTFVEGYRVELLRAARLLTAGDRHLAEDLVQTALVRLYSAWPRLREKPIAYAHRVIINAHIDVTRRLCWGDIKKNCASKEPEMAMARAKRLDPAYADHLDANIKCLNDHGVKAVVQDGGPALVDGLPSERKGHWLDDCEQEAFASYYSTLK